MITLALSACTGTRFDAATDAGRDTTTTRNHEPKSEDAGHTGSSQSNTDAEVGSGITSQNSDEQDASLPTSGLESSEPTSQASYPDSAAPTPTTSEPATDAALGSDPADASTRGPASLDSGSHDGGDKLNSPDSGTSIIRDSGSSDGTTGATLPTPSGVVPSDASTCPVDGGCDAGDAAHDAAAPSVVEAGSEPDANVDPNDECPHQPDQYVAGSCGCGFAPDEACNELAQKLTHRYSFDGEGHVAVDSVGDADGEIVDTELDGLGNLELAGIGSVELPAHVPLESTSATYEVWLTWHGGDDWQRIFDFGRLADDGSPEAYIYLSPRSGSASGKQALLFAYTTSGSGNTVHLHGDDELPIDTPSHVAVVLSARANRAALYLNGVRLGSGDFTPALADIGDTIDRLGRSLFPDDPGLDATLHEFRIYGETLGETVVAKSYELGPDAAFADIP